MLRAEIQLHEEVEASARVRRSSAIRPALSGARPGSYTTSTRRERH